MPRTPEQVAAAFFQAWQERRYGAMYDLLSAEAQAATPRDVFVRRYTSIEDGVGTTRLAVQAQPPRADAPDRQVVPFQVTRRVPIFGDLAESNDLPLARASAGAEWRVAWQPGLIFGGLTETSTVRVAAASPPRGRILDRNGVPLAENGRILAVGVVPGQVLDEAELLRALSDALGLPPETIKQRYQGGQPTWFMPIAERPLSDRSMLAQKLGTVVGAVVQERPARTYPLGEAAGHLTGYVARVTADDLKRLADQGYEESDVVGRAGVEAWAEKDLAGTKGGKILVVDQQGRTVRSIADKAAVPGVDVQLAVDAEVQAQAYAVLEGQTGSAVVLDPRDNGVLALASRPGFDPNRFVLGLSDAEWQALNGPDRPLVLRATETGYPIGSTFKVITMAAGLERAGYKPTDTFDCGPEWRGLPGVTLRNWTPQGRLDLVEALAQSCNPTFYEIGLKLDGMDPGILPDMARAFGLGQPSGVQGVDETPGVVPDPAWKRQQVGQPWVSGDSVNLAIGQGYLLATPLQVANAYSALAQGSLRTPLLVRAIRRPGGERTFDAEERGRLPISGPTRSAILAGMRRVAMAPTGTAAGAFQGERTPTAAKTGSAENEGPRAHAWFAGFQTPERPTALALVMVEGGETGGLVAAPPGHRLLDFAYAR